MAETKDFMNTDIGFKQTHTQFFKIHERKGKGFFLKFG